MPIDGICCPLVTDGWHFNSDYVGLSINIQLAVSYLFFFFAEHRAFLY